MIPSFVRLACLFAVLLTLARAQPAVSVPRFTHPGAGQTFYFVLTDRFANGSTANDTGGVPGGPDEHGFNPAKISHYHGGDFAGLTTRLDYLKNLGMTAVWLTPPLQNKPMQKGTAGYHGYWVTNFTRMDPHLGSNDEFRELVRQAHARGLKVFMDIITNHTADVIQYEGGVYDYVTKKAAPYRDATGRPFDEHAVAFNGVNDPAAFPALAAGRSFAYRPFVPEAEKSIKVPAWLNDVTLYHNRGDSTFVGENSVHGDFVGLDDLFTEHPRVVQGLIEVFSAWLETGVDGFRIDTTRHVNNEFWQGFIPALRARARALGRPDFLQFGEVYNEDGNPAVLSEFSTGGLPIDTTIDFGFFAAARRFVSQAGGSAALADFFLRDDYYTDHDSNVHATTTFLGNHDAGRFGYFLQQDNPGASPARLADLARLGHGLLLLARGQPVIYYGDEQGMIGRGGNDQQARESMFAAQAPDFATAPLLATTRIGADDKFDPQHPFYQLIARLGTLRTQHVALRTGSMLPRVSSEQDLFAFSRFDRRERVEYLAVFNNSRTQSITTAVPTSQKPGATLRQIFTSASEPAAAPAAVDAEGRLAVTLAPLQFAVWRAETALDPAGPAKVALVSPAPGTGLKFTKREIDGLVFPSRVELRAEVTGGDGFGEVTFALERASRPGQAEYLGTDDAPPYRVFWRPPNDLGPGEKFTVAATFNDLRGQRSSAALADLSIASKEVPTGIIGAKVPAITAAPGSTMVRVDETVTLRVAAEGTGPLEYQWLRNDEEVAGATDATLTFKASPYTGGSYRALVRNRAGTTLSQPAVVGLLPAFGRIESHKDFPSKLVPSRPVEVWLPPGYDENPAARYPVIYMHDGQNVFTNGTGYGGSTWETDRAMQKLLTTKTAPPAIIVGIWNTGLGRYPEYMPRKAVTADTVALFKNGPTMPAASIRSDAYLKFIVEELKPFVDRTYRTRPDRAHTSVMGSSMGGLISAYALCEYPEIFGGAGCVSTHWPTGDGAVIDYLAQHLPKPGTHKLWFDYGTATLDAQYEPYQVRMDMVMQAAGYTPGRDWITRKFEGAEHSEKSWRDRLDLPLKFLLGP
jgi:glycosidase/predicted alpha/beta superfamily hydrolase